MLRHFQIIHILVFNFAKFFNIYIYKTIANPLMQEKNNSSKSSLTFSFNILRILNVKKFEET